MHQHGITLSPPLGGNHRTGRRAGPHRALASTGVAVSVQIGRGYAVLPGVTPYRSNRVALKTSQLASQVEVATAALDVIPKRGAISVAKFDVVTGRLILNVTDERGQPVPFGSKVYASDEREVGMIGPGGEGFVTGAGDRGQLVVRWGKRADQRCDIQFDASGLYQTDDISELRVVCKLPDVEESSINKTDGGNQNRKGAEL